MATTNHETTLINGLLTAVNLTSYGVQKSATYDQEHEIDGAGVLCCSITGRQQAYPNQPIYFVSVRLTGMTFVSMDPDQAIIRQIYDDAMKSVQGWTAATLTTTVGLTIDGILPITAAPIWGEEDRYRFSIDLSLAMSGVTF